MELIRVPTVGRFGLNKDLSAHELPMGVWTDVNNIRFLDGYASLIYGETEFYRDSPHTPYYIFPVTLGVDEYWIHAGAEKVYALTNSGVVSVYTNLTRQTGGVDVNYAGAPNAWTFTTVSGIPVINAGNAVDPPQYWDLNLSSRFQTLTNWPANTYCKALRGFKSFLVALNITKSGTNYPYMVKWSNPAVPGGIPDSWDEADPTSEAGEFDLPDGYGEIVDGAQLRDSFMVYRKDSIWRMDLVGGSLMRFQKVIGNSGALNRNCIAEFLGNHLVLTNSDIIIHDGAQPSQVLDKVSRRWLFMNIEPLAIDKCFVFTNPYFNEIFICFPELGVSVPNKALVYNYRDSTISVRDLPQTHHAHYGPIPDDSSGVWAQDLDPWLADPSAWNGPDLVPNNSKVMLACASNKIYMLDSAVSNLGSVRACKLERRGLSLDAPETIKLVTKILPRILGQNGAHITISVGGQNDPYEEPQWVSQEFVLGETVGVEFLVAGRYIAVKFESGDAYYWRIDSFDVEFSVSGSNAISTII